ncbi:NUDIX domain-containing protein [Candidatus Saccharibacteria bacterium]|nr:NUDIX domain-containing protein [Candidatus Saccharibacteria bacterium]MBR3233727.1 NUDIX domain-containing protein [Candidatus Saccharibacteria bacterium]
MKNQAKKKMSPRKKHQNQYQRARKNQKEKNNLAQSGQEKQPLKPNLTYRSPKGTLKIPEALPTKEYKESAFSRIFHKKPAIQEIVREPTSGGIVFRMTPDQRDIEILLIQDSKNRWTIPKGHIEPGETAKQTAIREIGEESGLHHVRVLTWLGKIHFKYRRQDKLVLMTTQIYLVRALDEHEKPQKEKWMNGIKWFRFSDAIDAIEYEDIEKLMLIARKKIRAGEF